MRQVDSDTGVKAFLRAFGERWFTAMCGPLTVPFALLALFLEQKRLKALFGILAVVCAVFSSYWIWKREREAHCNAERQLQDQKKREILISQLVATRFIGFGLLECYRNKEAPIPDIGNWVHGTVILLRECLGTPYVQEFLGCVEKLPDGYTWPSKERRKWASKLFGHLEKLDEITNRVREGKI